MSFVDRLRDQHQAATAALIEVSRDVASHRSLSDDALLEFARVIAAEQRLVGATAAVVAGEIARRSSVSLGQSGLAQRTGHRTAVELVRITTGTTGRDAAAAVRAGSLAQDAADAVNPPTDPTTGEVREAERPWLHQLGRALTDGSLSAAAADAIRAGLGEPTDSVSAIMLTGAVEILCTEAVTLDADRLFRRARRLRDQLDEAGIADRENERYNARSLRFIRLPDGMARLIWLMDPETAASAGDLFDRATSPRRGGPRFVDADKPDHRLAQRITDDARTTEQLASDVFAELLSHGAAADSSQLLGTGAPVVRLVVTQNALDRGVVDTDTAPADTAPVDTERANSGHGHIEGQLDPVSIETIKRALCSGTVEPLLFDTDGHPLDVGREQRHYTRRQRRALAIRDGGCMFPGCEQPPSWTEAHHTKYWARDHGPTNIADGILLCRHHHLLCHNQHWEIHRVGTEFYLIAPPDIDPEQSPILLQTKSAVIHELTAQTPAAHPLRAGAAS